MDRDRPNVPGCSWWRSWRRAVTERRWRACQGCYCFVRGGCDCRQWPEYRQGRCLDCGFSLRAWFAQRAGSRTDWHLPAGHDA